jgi:hypothetical protein
MDPLSIIASAITIVSAISKIYDNMKDIQGLPKAFKEVGQNLNLADETLKLARAQLQSQNISESTKEAINPVLRDCERKATSLNRIFEEISKVEEGGKKAKDWAALASLYRRTVLHLGKAHRVETLMQGILTGLKGLAIHRVFSTENQEQMDKLERALESLSKVEPSLNDSDFDRSGTQLNQDIATGGTGNQFVNEAGYQTNKFGGNDYNTGGAAMYFGTGFLNGKD